MRLLSMSFALLAATSPPATAQTSKRLMTVDDQFRLLAPNNPLLSPDGKWVLYTIDRPSLPENVVHSSVWLATTLNVRLVLKTKDEALNQHDLS